MIENILLLLLGFCMIPAAFLAILMLFGIERRRNER